MRSYSTKFVTPAAPGNNATIVLWSSATEPPMGKKRMRAMNMAMLQIAFLAVDQASAANGLKAYVSSDGGTTWRQTDMKDATGTATMPKTVPVLASPAMLVESYDVSPFDDFKVELTAGATGPTVWDVVITGIFGGSAVQV